MTSFMTSVVLFLSLTLVPLLFSTGRNLEYEFCLALAMLYQVVLPLVTVFTAKQGSVFFLNVNKRLNIFWNFQIGLLAAFAVTLVLAAAFFQLGLSLCGRLEFLCWFLINTGPAIILGFLICLVLLHFKDRSKFQRVLMLCGFYSLCAIDLGVRLWCYPQKRIVHYFFGFLHGPIYDLWIPIDWGVILGRLSHGVLSLAAIFAILLPRGVASRIATLTFLAGFFILQFTVQDELSIGHGHALLTNHLPASIEGDGFTLHYQNKEESLRTTRAAKQLASEASFHIRELGSMLHLENSPHVEIYAYPDRDFKKLAFGGGHTDVTDVVTPSIHILLSSGFHESLRHELVHALASEIAFFGLGFHPNMALTEGLAVALAPEANQVSLDRSAFAILESKRIKDPASLLSPFFWKESGARAYVLAGSLVRFILRQHGSQVLNGLYAGRQIETLVEGQSLSLLMDAWKESLALKMQGAKANTLSERLFRAPGVLRQQCPHSRAVFSRRSGSHAFLSFRQGATWNAKDDYETWLDSLRSSGGTSSISRLKRQFDRRTDRFKKRNRDKKSKPRAFLAREMLPDLDAGIRLSGEYLEAFELRLLRSDLLALFAEAESIDELETLRHDLQKYDLGAAFERKVFARLEVMHLSSSIERLKWRRYLAAWSPLPKMSNEGSISANWMLTYLRLRRSHRGRDYTKNTLVALSQNDSLPVHLPSSFKLEWQRLLAEAFIEKKEYKLAQRAYALCETIAQEASQEWFAQKQRMAQFFAEQSAI